MAHDLSYNTILIVVEYAIYCQMPSAFGRFNFATAE